MCKCFKSEIKYFYYSSFVLMDLMVYLANLKKKREDI